MLSLSIFSCHTVSLFKMPENFLNKTKNNKVILMITQFQQQSVLQTWPLPIYSYLSISISLIILNHTNIYLHMQDVHHNSPLAHVITTH